MGLIITMVDNGVFFTSNITAKKIPLGYQPLLIKKPQNIITVVVTF